MKAKVARTVGEDRRSRDSEKAMFALESRFVSLKRLLRVNA